MPTAQELKKAWEELDAQIVAVKQEEREAEEARLRAKEEACVAAEKARLEEETRKRELMLEEVQVWAEEEAQKQEEERRVHEEEEWHVRKEEERPMVERDVREEGGPSLERAPRRRLFLPSLSDSAGSPEEEEGMEVSVTVVTPSQLQYSCNSGNVPRPHIILRVKLLTPFTSRLSFLLCSSFVLTLLIRNRHLVVLLFCSIVLRSQTYLRSKLRTPCYVPFLVIAFYAP